MQSDYGRGLSPSDYGFLHLQVESDNRLHLQSDYGRGLSPSDYCLLHLQLESDNPRNQQTVIAYDNFNFKDNVRDQALGSSHAIMRNMMTALLVTCPYLPQNGLTQDMFHPEKLLSYKTLMEAPGLPRDY
ncbi:hypothetical protein V8E54_008039 [Elaphomyces granulatus]